MSISPKNAALLSFVSLLLFLGINAVVSLTDDRPPKIQGVVIPAARSLPEFTLIDHHHRAFGNDELRGNWFLLAYGFTHCPDVCPTLLNTLARVERKLQSQGVDDLRVLFYTIDPQRDTVEHMAKYVAFFSERFIGLTRGENPTDEYLSFEKSLGMVYSLDSNSQETTTDEDKSYDVSHGVYLYLLNPEGKLQAIFKPEPNEHGLQVFKADKVTRDYLALRDHFG